MTVNLGMGSVKLNITKKSALALSLTSIFALQTSQGVVEARSVLRALSRVSQCPELCALANILFYVTVVRIRVFMRTLESNLVLIVVVCCASCAKRAQIGD